jgi:phosphoglycerate dehydrogenase-like enzyme
MVMRVLVGAAARGRPAQYRKEIAAVLPSGLSDASIDFDLGDDAQAWGAGRRTADAVILTSRGLAASAIASAANLKFVQKLGLDIDRVDLDACRQHGVRVALLPDAGHIAVAEHCIAMALAGTRNLIPTHNALVRKDNPRGLEPIATTQNKRHVNWLDWPEDAFRLASDLTLGLIGFGEIAREVARRATGLFARIVYTKRTRLGATVEQQYGVTFMDRSELLATSDIVSLHATLADHEPPIIGARELSAMKPGAFLVNTARGNQVHQQALICALNSGHLRGAALDVFEREPVFDDALLDLPNVVLTPHTANLMPTGRRFRGALDNVLAFHRGDNVAGLVVG